MKQRTEREWIELDLRSCAVHEVGHAVVARMLGCPNVSISVWRNGAWRVSGASGEECSVFGQTHLNGPLHGKTSLSAVGWAGVISECLEDDSDFDFWQVLDFVECGVLEPSPTDAALIATASDAWRNRAPRRTFEILNKTRAERKFLVDFLVDRFFENGGTVASIGWGEGAWRDTNGEPLRVQPRGQVAA